VEGLIQHSLDRGLEFVGDEFLYQNLSHHLLRRVAHKLLRIFISNLYSPLRIHSKDWHVGRVNKLGVLPLLSQAVGDVLANTHHTNHIPLFVMSSRLMVALHASTKAQQI
jgi:hypothetical protein